MTTLPTEHKCAAAESSQYKRCGPSRESIFSGALQWRTRGRFALAQLSFRGVQMPRMGWAAAGWAKSSARTGRMHCNHVREH